MVRTRRHTAVVRGVLVDSVFQHPTLYEYIGKRKYLQMALSKAVARAYAAKFDAVTSKRISRYAAKHGYLPLLSWARDVGCPWNEELFLSAVRGGHISVMEFLLENDCPLPRGSRAFESALDGGTLQTLEWLHQHEFPWDEEVSSGAAGLGWLEGLKWLQAHGCPWNSRTRLLCVVGNRLEVLKWAHYNNCPGNNEDLSRIVAMRGKLDILKWMLDEGCAFSSCNGWVETGD